MVTKDVLHKRAQRAYPKPDACKNCGSTLNLQRHHPNPNDALIVAILCQPCHAKEHVRLGTWGKGAKKPKICVVCGRAFSVYSHSRVKTCGPICLSELGRRNARKRWDHVLTDCEDSETP